MPLLEMKGITKRFGGVIANKQVNLTVEAGSIHALLGENGAGKTTLMNILYGLYQADEGTILWDGKPVQFRTPQDAIAQGIGMVHQHFMLVRTLTVLQNIILGLKPEGYPVMKTSTIAESLKALSQQYGLLVDMNQVISQLSVGEQQRVEILKALYRKAKLLVLDEPTAVLTPQETQELFVVLRALRDSGCSIILISHRLAEIMQISDHISVLRGGELVSTVETAHCTEGQLSSLMIGHTASEESLVRKPHTAGEEILKISNLSLTAKGKKHLLDHISLSVHRGEILGIAGVDGNGQNYLAEAICGIRRQSEDCIQYNGEWIDHLNVRQRFERGISYIPDDRHKDGLILDADVRENLALRTYRSAPLSRHGVLNRKNIASFASQAVDAYTVKTESINARVGNLSGGNQQKLIIARELSIQPSLLVAMQPTRGLDIGASAYVHEQLMQSRERGSGIILISTDLEEILALSDRIAVMFGGRIMGIVPNTDALQPETLGMLMGGHTWEEVSTQ